MTLLHYIGNFWVQKPGPPFDQILDLQLIRTANKRYLTLTYLPFLHNVRRIRPKAGKNLPLNVWAFPETIIRYVPGCWSTGISHCTVTLLD